MSSFDLHNSIKTESALDFTTITADGTTTGKIIDLKNFESVEFVMVPGGIPTDTDIHTPKLYEGDESNLSDAVEVDVKWLVGTPNVVTPDGDKAEYLGDFTAIADATVYGTDPVTSDPDSFITKRIGYVGKKRYVRLDFVTTGWTANSALGAVAVKSAPDRAPTEKDGQ